MKDRQIIASSQDRTIVTSHLVPGKIPLNSRIPPDAEHEKKLLKIEYENISRVSSEAVLALCQSVSPSHVEFAVVSLPYFG